MEPSSKIVDRRARKFSMIENAVVDVWAAEVGVYGLAVYAALCRFSNSESQCFPSREKIASLLAMSPRQVTRSITALKECGLIEVEVRYRPKAGGQTSNNYILCDVPEFIAQDVVEAPGLSGQARLDSVARGGGLTVQPRLDCQSNDEQDLVINKTQGNGLCSLNLSSLKESDLENFDSLLRLMAGCDSHEVFRMLAILAGVDRMATTAPGRKLESRVAAFRWFVAHPDRITLGDEDTARRVARDVRKLSPEVQEIIEGLTWVDSSESTKTDQQDNRSERPNLFDKISDASESRGRAASNRKSRQSGQPKKTPR